MANQQDLSKPRKVICLSIGSDKESIHGGIYRTVIFRDLDSGESLKMYLYDRIQASLRWKEFLKPQAIFDNVNLFKKGIVNAYCDFRFVGIKEKIN